MKRQRAGNGTEAERETESKREVLLFFTRSVFYEFTNERFGVHKMLCIGPHGNSFNDCISMFVSYLCVCISYFSFSVCIVVLETVYHAAEESVCFVLTLKKT